MNGADLLCEALLKHGVQDIFLYPGAKNIGIINSIKKSGIKGHLCRHEQGCIFAAEGYAKSSNKVGIVLTTSGPGAANTVTGIADAFSDSVPVIILTAQVSIQASGTEAFQEMPTAEIVKPITKAYYYIRKASDICHVIDQAFFYVQHERSRPIVIDIPSNIQSEMGHFDPELIHYNRRHMINPTDIQYFINMLLTSKRPVIYTGGGCKYGFKQLSKMFEFTGEIPTVSSVMGLGCVDGKSTHFLGLMGMHGLYAANFAIHECDLLISFGGRFCERATCNIKKFAPHARVIHIDIDSTEIGKKIHTELGVCADIKDFLNALNAQLMTLDLTGFKSHIHSWLDICKHMKQVNPQTKYITCENENHINGQRIVHELDLYCKNHNISPFITTGVGKHQVFTSQIFRHENPWKWITSGALASMGFGIPSAIGAAIANPGHPVVCIEGDGSILMNIQELATLYNEDLPVKIILFNNQILGMVEQIEDEVYHDPHTFTFLGCMHNVHNIYPDFNKIVDGFMIKNKVVSTVEELDPAFDEMFKDDKPFLLNVIIKDSYIRPEIMDGECFENIII